MGTITRQRIRFAGDSVRFDGPRDKLRTAMPVFWRGNDLQFEVAVFENDVLQDISNLTQLTLEIKALGSDGTPPDPTATALMSKSVDAVDMNNSLTLTQWNDGSAQHAILSFSGQESNIAADENWLVLWATTNDVPGRIITLAAGRIKVLEDGAGLSTTPSPPQDTFYNTVQSDARFAQRVQNLSDLSDIPTARTNLGLAIGSDVQAFSDNLGDIAALTPTKGNLLAGDGTDWVAVGVGTNGQHLEADSAQASGVKWGAAGGGGGLPVPDTTSIVEGSVDATKEVRIEVDGLTTATTRVWTAPDQDVDLTPGNTFQAADAGLLSIAGLTTAADKMIYTTASNTYAVADLTAAGRALLDDANAAAQRITLGLQIGTDVQAYHAYLADLAGLTPAKGTVMVFDGTDWVAVGVGTNDDLLTADSAQASGVKWAAGGGGGDTLPIVDTTAVVKGSADATKLVRIEADGLTTGTTKVITMADQDIDLTPGNTFEAADAGLLSIAGLTTAADKMIYTTASDTYAVADLTAAGRALLDDANAAAQRTTLGLGSIATQASNSVSITGGTITGITDLTVADGGTGASTLTDGGILLGSGTGAITPMAILAKGSIVVGDGVTDPIALAVGTNDQVLTADSAQASGVKWAAGGGGGGPSQATQSAIEAETNEDTYLPPDLLKHHPGVGKAWANWDQNVVVNGSYNVDSVTDVGAGDWTVNFTTDFSALGYLAIAQGRDDSGGGFRREFAAAEDAVGSCAVICIKTTDGTKADTGGGAADDIHLLCLGDFA